MPVISPSFSTAPCRQFLIHHLLCIYLVAAGPARAASYRSPSLYTADGSVHRQGQYQPVVLQYYPRSSGTGNTIKSSDSHSRSNRPASAWIYGRPATEQQWSARMQPGARDAVEGAVESSPRVVGEWASRNPVSKTNAKAYLSSVHRATLQNSRKRVAETADLSLGGYDKLGSRTRYGKRYQTDRRQVFEPMPPFQPPPSGTILPDLFSPQALNGSSSIIGQRPTRPSTTGSNPYGTTADGRGYPPGDNGFHSGSGEPQFSSQGQRLSGQNQRELDDQGPIFNGPDPYGPEREQNEEIVEGTNLPGTDGVWKPQGVHPPVDLPPDLPSSPFSWPSQPPFSYQGLPATRPPEYTETPYVEQGHFNPHDVLVKIETRRLQLTYSANAPPYFTFESLLYQLATYLMPGFCVDLAVTRRDERCEIISHMAALKTDRLQNWLIEISDKGGKIIWMNQCIPDSRLFIVSGFRVHFKYGVHVFTPATTPGSTPEASPVDTGPARQETAQPPEGLPISADGQQPAGPPLVPQRQTSEYSLSYPG